MIVYSGLLYIEEANGKGIQWQVSLLTQKQPGLNNANLQVQAKVLHIATTTPTAGLCFHNMNCGIFPAFYNFLSS